jgi:hypothetical protein
MMRARSVAVLTWIYAAAFGLPAIPVFVYLLQRGSLPTFMGLFEMYGGPWSRRFGDGAFAALLIIFLAVTLVASWGSHLMWKGSKVGAVLNLVLLPIEALFWLGFALPFPWLIGIARVMLTATAWGSLNWPQGRIATPR